MLRFQIEGLAEGDTIYLANYYGNKMYYADTAVVGAKGSFEYPPLLQIREANTVWCFPRMDL